MPVASAFSLIAPPSASISRTICPFANPPIAGLQDIWPIESKFWVSIKVRQPSLADASAASIPAWPLPTTITSYSVGSLNTTRSLQNSVSWQRQELRVIELLHVATERCRASVHIRIKLGEHLTGTARCCWFRRLHDNGRTDREFRVWSIGASSCHRGGVYQIAILHNYLSCSYLCSTICSNRGVPLPKDTDKLSASRIERKAVRVKRINKSTLIAKAPPHVQYSTKRGCVFPRARLRLS